MLLIIWHLLGAVIVSNIKAAGWIPDEHKLSDLSEDCHEAPTSRSMAIAWHAKSQLPSLTGWGLNSQVLPCRRPGSHQQGAIP